jgi:hypothetical protein
MRGERGKPSRLNPIHYEPYGGKSLERARFLREKSGMRVDDNILFDSLIPAPRGGRG